MKNSRTSQIAALVLLAISDIVLFLAAFGSMRLRNQICRSTAVCYFLLVVMMGALIYYIVMSKEKKFSIIISVIAVGAELLVTFLRAYIILFGRSRHVSMGKLWYGMRNAIYFEGMAYTFVFCGGVFLAMTIIFAALLVTFIKTKPVAQRKKEVSNTTPSATKEYAAAYVDDELYCGLTKHILLLLFTFGIWFLIWIYRITSYTNCVKDEEERNPTKKLLLCLFVPFYQIYWTYKSAQRIDKMAAAKGLQSDLSTLCLILAIFVPIIPPILMQDKLNAIATSKNANVTPVQNSQVANDVTTGTAEELKKYKELLDQGVVTQEEFDAKKKQLLGL